MSGEQKKERLDVLLVNKGLSPSREKAKSQIMAGLVIVDGKRIDKCGAAIPKNAAITLIGDSIGYVSRGGLKFEKALEYFNIDLNGKIMVDVGASTGGFTDCALKKGAAKVFAIDVGYGQLAWPLRQDSRVVNMERTNIRQVTLNDLGVQPDFVSIDVAFISLTKVLPVIKFFLPFDGKIIALIKPQFEVGREKVGKRGVVKDPLAHQEVILNIVAFAKELFLFPIGLTYSPIKGPEGNIEYLIYLHNIEKESDESLLNAVNNQIIAEIVMEAHRNLQSAKLKKEQ